MLLLFWATRYLRNSWYRSMLLNSQFFQRFDCPMKGNPRQSWILDSKPWMPDSRYWVPVFVTGTHSGFRIQSFVDSGFLELSTRIPKPRIPDSTSKCSLYSGFHKPKFIRFHFKRLLRDYYVSTLQSCYNVEDPRTGKTICLKCNYARTLISRLPCCF